MTETTIESVADVVADVARRLLAERSTEVVDIQRESSLNDIGIDSLATLVLFVRLESRLGISLAGLGAIDRPIRKINDVAEVLWSKFGENAHV